MRLFVLERGISPLIISIPHSGIYVPEIIKERFTEEALALPDTDWHVDRLYSFAETLGATILQATHSRYVIDLNRSPDNVALYPGRLNMPLCPAETFDGTALYQSGETPDEQEVSARVAQYWQPYHDVLRTEIARVRNEYGYALLYDAHSIRSRVPRLFEQVLPDLNLGTNDNESCSAKMAEDVLEAVQKFPCKSVLNGRFKGGYITRHYGDPDNHIHALQMELSQINYMDEEKYIFDAEKAALLQPALQAALESMLEWSKEKYGRSGE